MNLLLRSGSLCLCLVLAACGSKKDPQDPAGVAPGGPGAGPGETKVDRNLSEKNVQRFASAVAYFQEQEKAGWNSSNCAEAANRFKQVAEVADKMVEAYFNAGVVHQRCGNEESAEEMYKAALSIMGSHAPSLANLGEIYYRRGNDGVAKKYWERAFEADKQVVAAQNNLAWLLYQQMRTTENPKARDALEKEALTYLQRVLAVDNDNIEAYTIMALIYLLGAEDNRSRLDVANLLLEEGKKRNDRYAPLYNAWGLLQLEKENVSQALRHFQNAMQLDPNFTEARLNAARVVGDFRKYQEAEQYYRKVLEDQSMRKELRYDALIGLGFALRGQGKIDEAEKLYAEAMEVDKTRGEAFYNMGLLWKDFRTNDPSPAVNRDAYAKARTFFQQFLARDGLSKGNRVQAQEHIEDTEEAVKILNQAIQQMQQMDAQPQAAS